MCIKIESLNSLVFYTFLFSFSKILISSSISSLSA
uniref:Uncharacterized protein n=1 Tax=Myoviridae sp. ct1ba2 TaxID=2827654 RepID=A0A8S5S785_9CAUD|nr:MAG TPA: hypothetical protein [Myoviridae sp. ct1ba2]